MKLALVMLLTACATPYQARGLRGGYEDHQLAPGVFSISVTGNSYTSADTMRVHVRRRAMELCGGADKFTLEDEQTGTTQTGAIYQSHGYGTVTQTNVYKPFVSATARCKGAHTGAQPTAKTLDWM